MDIRFEAPVAGLRWPRKLHYPEVRWNPLAVRSTNAPSSNPTRRN